MATHLPVVVTRDEWERDWLSWPEAMFLALDGDAIVGCAGLAFDPDDQIDPSKPSPRSPVGWRRRRLATALKRLSLRFAAEHGVREVYTWTQRDDADMRALRTARLSGWRARPPESTRHAA